MTKRSTGAPPLDHTCPSNRPQTSSFKVFSLQIFTAAWGDLARSQKIALLCWCPFVFPKPATKRSKRAPPHIPFSLSTLVSMRFRPRPTEESLQPHVHDCCGHFVMLMMHYKPFGITRSTKAPTRLWVHPTRKRYDLATTPHPLILTSFARQALQPSLSACGRNYVCVASPVSKGPPLPFWFFTLKQGAHGSVPGVSQRSSRFRLGYRKRTLFRRTCNLNF